MASGGFFKGIKMVENNQKSPYYKLPSSGYEREVAKKRKWTFPMFFETYWWPERATILAILMQSQTKQRMRCYQLITLHLLSKQPLQASKPMKVWLKSFP